MTVKLAVLKSGEDVIADIHEIIVGESEENEKVVGYIFTKPCLVTLGESINSEEDQENRVIEIKMTPWISLSKTIQVPVSLDWVVTIVDPVDKLKEMYEQDVLKNGESNDQNSINAEQSSTDNAD